MFADELAKMEVKFKEQLKTNENLKLQLAAEEDRYKVSSSESRHLVLRSGHSPPVTLCRFRYMSVFGHSLCFYRWLWLV